MMRSHPAGRRAVPTYIGMALALFVAACADDPISPAPDANAVDTPALGVNAAEESVPGEVLVRFRPGVDGLAVARAHGASVERGIAFGIKVLRVPVGAEARVAAALSRNPNVEFAEPNFVRTFGFPCETTGCILPNDPYLGYKWDLHNDGTIKTSAGVVEMSTGRADADIDWLEAYDQLGGSLTGSAVIGILDTGVNPNHPDLSGKVLSGYDFVNNDNNPMDDDGHGTHVAGIAAAHGNNGTGVVGVAWGSNVKILPVKVCGPGGCPISAIVDGIYYAVNNGAHVINLSLGGRTGSTAEQVALQYALANDVLPICAAGNDGRKQVSYPAAFPECVAVGATNWSDGRAKYSNTGDPIELAAPGGDTEDRKTGRSYILSTYHDGGYVFMYGTSMAAPQVAGLAALLHATGVRGASTIRNRMTSTADDLGTSGRDRDFGYGRINVYRALNNITDGGDGGGGDGGGNGGGGNGGGNGGGGKCHPVRGC